MSAYIITIETQIRVELADLDDATRKHLSDNYQTASLPDAYSDAEFIGGQITYQKESE